jgi:hypothetical protein
MDLHASSSTENSLANVEDVQPEDLHVLRETHKYIFFGPMHKDLKNTYFGAVYLYEKKLRFQAGQKVVLAHNSKDVYGIALVGQAQNRQVWVWLVSLETEEMVKRLIVQVQDIVGWQTPKEREICKNSLARYQRRSRSYDSSVRASQSDSSPIPAKILTPRRQTRGGQNEIKSDEDSRPKRAKRRIEIDEYSESEDSFAETDSESDSESSPERRERGSPIIKRQRKNQPSFDRKSQLRKQTGDLFMTLLECVVMTLAKEYPNKNGFKF